MSQPCSQPYENHSGDGSHLMSRWFDLQTLRSRGDAILHQMMSEASRAEQAKIVGVGDQVSSPTPSPRLAQILSCYTLPSPSTSSLDEPGAFGIMQKHSTTWVPGDKRLNTRRKIPNVFHKTKRGKLEQIFSQPDKRAVFCFSSPQHALDELNKYFSQQECLLRDM
eukprot:TRINITY_DN52208_c0_g1_i1.p1 TRINITY_DN52208_c0_g1~~TRINITY_DN52208_c0_g1_i1.p1  ORF type:complete len:166 (-),score=24.54 TRINITY_DN52208_c0_g1_i1:211-708(-)